MIKRTLVVLALIGICSVAGADPIDIPGVIKKLPSLKQGVAWSVAEKDFNYITTASLIDWEALSLEAGYSTSDKAVAVVSFDLLKLEKYVELPILKDIKFRIGYYVGYGGIDIANTEAKLDHGVSLTAFEVKF
jgi:hypothetical protein